MARSSCLNSVMAFCTPARPSAEDSTGSSTGTGQDGTRSRLPRVPPADSPSAATVQAIASRDPGSSQAAQRRRRKSQATVMAPATQASTPASAR
jgi:hypothetical protein